MVRKIEEFLLKNISYNLILSFFFKEKVLRNFYLSVGMKHISAKWAVGT